MTFARGSLIAGGVALAGYGVALLVTTLDPVQLVSLGVWLVATLIVHDGVLAPAVNWLHVRWYRRSDTRPRAVGAAVHIGFVVGGVLTLFVAPEIWAQGRGNPNPTILIGDYALRLLLVWATIGAVVLIVSRIALRTSRR